MSSFIFALLVYSSPHTLEISDIAPFHPRTNSGTLPIFAFHNLPQLQHSLASREHEATLHADDKEKEHTVVKLTQACGSHSNQHQVNIPETIDPGFPLRLDLPD